MTLMSILKMQYLVNKEKLKFHILRLAKSVGVQAPSQEQDQKLVQHAAEVDKSEEPPERLSVILHKLLNVQLVMVPAR